VALQRRLDHCVDLLVLYNVALIVHILLEDEVELGLRVVAGGGV
jgi:hypothetical protein